MSTVESQTSKCQVKIFQGRGAIMKNKILMMYKYMKKQHIIKEKKKKILIFTLEANYETNILCTFLF